MGKPPLSESAHTCLRELFEYWSERRGDRRMPARSDIDPADIPRLLPHLLLADVENDVSDVRFRLVGTELVESFGGEFTGHHLSELDYGNEADAVAESYARAISTGEPQFKISHFWTRDYRHRRIQQLLLPLSDDGEHVSMILAGVYRD